jgi:signal transduction histidine kinase/ligand-binding sensor domain-containing protein/CheY-like chemotaxis protein
MPSQYHQTTWMNTDAGLPQVTILALLQTRDGYLWVGTQDGLARFDGVRFTIFTRSNTPGLGGNWINTLFEDRAGRLWVGTHEGVSRLKDGVWKSWSAANGLSSDDVQAITEDAAGAMLFGSPGGLDRMEGDRITAYGAGRGLPPGPVRRLLVVDRDLWVGTERAGLFRVQPQAQARVQPGPPQGDPVTDLQPDGLGGLWAASRSFGLFHVRGGQAQALGASLGFPHTTVGCLRSDPDGNLWIGTGNAGLVRLAKGRLASYTQKMGLCNDQVHALLVDREGGLWVGTQYGLAYLRDDAAVTFSQREGLPTGAVWGVSSCRKGGVWVATDQGLALIDGERITPYFGAGQRKLRVCCAMEYAGVLLAGTADGLMELRGDHLAPSPRASRWKTSEVFLLFSHPDGSLWVGTDLGLYRQKAGQERHYTAADGLPSGKLRRLYVDRQGQFWVGTHSGLYRLDPAQDRFVPGPPVFANRIVLSMFEDRRNRFWVGTSSGLFLRDGDHFKPLGMRDGLIDDAFCDFCQDAQGNFWASTHHGIARILGPEMDAFLAGTTASLHPKAFPPKCNGGTQPNLCKASDGSLWFPSLEGAVRIDPVRVMANPVRPVMAIEEVFVNGAAMKVPAGGRWAFPAESMHLEFHYTALSLREPAKVRFRYHLDGFDKDWIEAGPQRTAYFTNLRPGNYVFRVVACNEDGLWCLEPGTLAFRLRPHFYETAWFMAACALAGLGALLGLHRLRVRHLRFREEALQALVERRTQDLKLRTSQLELSEQKAQAANLAKSTFLANMSHELRTPLNAILGFAQLTLRDPGANPAILNNLGRILRAGEHLLGLINDVLSIAKIEAGRLTVNTGPFRVRDLVLGLAEMMGVRCSEKGLALDVRVAEDVPEVLEGDEGKLRQVLLNLLGNAVKFTQAGTVTLRVSRQGEATAFEVRDTGPGMGPGELDQLFRAFIQTETGQKAKEGTGLGLHISQAMVQLMGGRIEVESEPGAGSCFQFALPFKTLGLEELPHTGAGAVLGLAEGQASRKILVVDDRADNRDLLRDLLAGWGFEVRVAVDGVAAVAAWEAWQPDLVWMDLRMPRMDGREAVAKIRALEVERKLPRTPVFALSASVLEIDRTTVLSAGFDDFIFKPFQELQIAETLETHMDIRFRRTLPEDAPKPETALQPETLARGGLEGGTAQGPGDGRSGGGHARA